MTTVRSLSGGERPARRVHEDERMGNLLAKVLTRDALRREAGAKSYRRGEAYFEDGAIRGVVEDKDILTAKVEGTRNYTVRLWAEGNRLGYSCSCPLGVDGVFCKHCVATGLTWLARDDVPEGRPTKPKPAVTMDHVRAYLARQKSSMLVDVIMEQTLGDEHLRERLLLEVATKRSQGPDIATFHAAIDNAVDTGGFVDYRHAYDYARGIEQVVESIRTLLKEGHADAVIELAEHALGAVEDALGAVDDSDGEMGRFLDDLQELHHDACKKAKPDPEALAKRLFEWEVRSGWDAFHAAAATYADVLGKRGLTCYRRLAEAEWASVPALKPGADDPERYGKRRRIQRIMEALAEQAGDVEALVAVKSRDLSRVHTYLEIAELYKHAGDHDNALAWAEEGMKAFPERPDARLREFLAEEYHRRKRHDEAMALIWDAFTARPHLETYQGLATHAKRIQQWPSWRDKALALLRESIARAKGAAPKQRTLWSAAADHSVLVRIFLWERRVEAAWKEAAEGGCSGDLWITLAEKREKKHPEDAVPIYQKAVERALRHASNDAYREAIHWLRKVRGVTTRLGREREFEAYLSEIRADNKRRRNFIKMLDRAKW